MGAPTAAIAQHAVQRYRDGSWTCDQDTVAIEEPLEIRVAWDDGITSGRQPLTVTMRTPGNDFELAAGLLFAEGIVRERGDIEAIRYCLDVEDEEQRRNTVAVTLRRGLGFDAARQERNLLSTSACGICGKTMLSAIEMHGCKALPAGPTVSAGTVCALPALLREAQAGFATTGGLHACGLFELDGTVVAVREDIGRHNAFDKLVGQALFGAGVEALAGRVAVLSGRASYELLQKAAMARIPVVVAIGAPSTLAVRIAETFSMTLAGFTRDDGFNVYAGRERIVG